VALGDNRIRIGILGASGYTGAELIRILARHPAADIRLLSAERSAGKDVDAVFPHLSGLDLPKLIHIDDADWSTLDLVFCALPHGTTQEVVAALPDHLKIVDLSADFRLHDLAAYETWYGHAHKAPDLQGEAVYGLTEVKRDTIRDARLCANPGCYPTAAQLPLIPLLEAGLIEAEDIIIDAKSGVSGAGRAAKEASLFAEVSEGIHAYGVASHRHSRPSMCVLRRARLQPSCAAYSPNAMPRSLSSRCCRSVPYRPRAMFAAPIIASSAWSPIV